MASALACALLAACAASGSQLGQVAGPSPSWQACVARVPAAALTLRETVYVHAEVPDSGARALRPEADTLALRVGVEVRALLGGDPRSLPAGEPAITWADALDGPLLVTAHRDGRATWRDSLPPGSTDSAPSQLLARAVAAVEREAPIAWHAGAGPDSMLVRLFLARYYARVRAGPGESGRGALVFVLRVPPVTRPVLGNHLPLDVSDLPPYERVSTHLVMEVIVDARGRPEPESIRELPASDPEGDAGVPPEEHAVLVRAARTLLLSASFVPERVGGCPLRVRIQVPFNFRFPAPVPARPGRG